jgi:hypothetical protein
MDAWLAVMRIQQRRPPLLLGPRADRLTWRQRSAATAPIEAPWLLGDAAGGAGHAGRLSGHKNTPRHFLISRSRYRPGPPPCEAGP